MQNSEVCGRPALSQTSVRVCSTCLAGDRVLLSLHKTPQLLNICNGLTLSIANLVCYECHARLNNFFKFRSRALRAEKLLACVLSSYGLPESKMLSPDIQCLSTLKQTIISPHETLYLDGDFSSFGDLVHVKIEVVETEPKPEVKAEMLEVLSESVTSKTVKKSKTAKKDLKINTKAEDADDFNSDTSSEDGEPQQIEDPLITVHFTAKHMELPEVLSHMEKTRNLTRYKSALYKCDKCALTFISESQFRAHNTRHSDEQGSLKCEVCEHRFKSGKALGRHSATHYTRYACRHCARSCFSYHQMYVHYRNVHDRETLRLCGKCPASFKNYKELLHHKQRAHARKYPCPKCDRQYRSSVGLWRHHFVHDATVPELECHICHKKYKGEFYLKDHIRNVHETKPGAYCTECELQFKTPAQYKQHLKRTKRHMPDDNSTYDCDYCGKRFAQKPTLTQHIEVTHLKLCKHKCDFCDDRFNTKRYAVNHMRRIHSDEPRGKKHVCHVCAKAFTLRKSLDEHMNAHLGVRPFECKLCGATFAYNSALYNHNQLVHLKKTRRSKNTVKTT